MVFNRYKIDSLSLSLSHLLGLRSPSVRPQEQVLLLNTTRNVAHFKHNMGAKNKSNKQRTHFKHTGIYSCIEWLQAENVSLRYNLR